MRKLTGTDIAVKTAKYIFLTLLLAVFLVPLYTVLVTAFKTQAEVNAGNVFALPHSFLYLSNFGTVFRVGRMAEGFGNTFFIIAASLVGAIFNGTCVGFVLSRFKFKFNVVVNALFAGAVMIPSIVSQIPLFKLINSLGLFDSQFSAILLYWGTDIVSIYIFVQFMSNIPVSLDEAAIIDGCNYFQVYTKIIIPLLSPAIVTVIITKGVAIYNDFYIPFLYIPDHYTLATSLFSFKGPFGTKMQMICAGVLILIIPTLIAFLALQKFIYRGLVSGAVKE